MRYYSVFLRKRKGGAVYKVDVIEKNWGHFWIQRSRVSQKQLSHVTQRKVCFPVLSDIVSNTVTVMHFNLKNGIFCLKLIHLPNVLNSCGE